MFSISISMTAGAALRAGRIGYNVMRDIAPVSMISVVANGVLVHPSVPAVTIQEFVALSKAHLRVDTNADDTFITSLITTSRLQVEAILGLALIQQSWTWRFDAWPAGAAAIPLRPVMSVAAVRVQGSDLAWTTLPAAAYLLDGNGVPARLVPNGIVLQQPGAPANGIEIQFTAGFGAAANDVPAPLRQAILLLVAHWYENREPLISGVPATRFPDAVIGLVEPYRVRRL